MGRWVKATLLLCSYREASVEVIEVMSRFAVIERASIDEAYMDLTAAVQQRLKDMSEMQIEPHLLRTTYIQGYPKNVPDQAAPAEDVAVDKGRWKTALKHDTQGSLKNWNKL